ncbi:hypothetical protein BRC97_03945 [Halobacteriales archaeon QS_6_71_20]|nr:MAG: hypothetical protein BRC97_03945 [Halobacteriales archaeon QS_6_71_20]
MAHSRTTVGAERHATIASAVTNSRDSAPRSVCSLVLAGLLLRFAAHGARLRRNRLSAALVPATAISIETVSPMKTGFGRSM